MDAHHSRTGFACHTCALPAVCHDCLKSCHVDHVVSTVLSGLTVEEECGCRDGAACTLPAVVASTATGQVGDELLTAMVQFAVIAGHSSFWRSELQSRSDQFGYIIVSHLLSALDRVGCNLPPILVPQIVSKTLAKCPFFRISKSGSVGVRLQPRHPRVNVILALAAPFVPIRAGSDLVTACPLGPLPLDRVVEPSVLQLAGRLGLRVSFVPTPVLAGSVAEARMALLTRPADVVSAAPSPEGPSVGGEHHWLYNLQLSKHGIQLQDNAPHAGNKRSRMDDIVSTGRGGYEPAGVAEFIQSPHLTMGKALQLQAARVHYVSSLEQLWQCSSALYATCASAKESSISLKVYALPDGMVPGPKHPERHRIALITIAHPDGIVLIINPRAIESDECTKAGDEEEISDAAGASTSTPSSPLHVGYGRLLHPLLPLLLNPTISKIIHNGSEDIMWLSAESGLSVVNAWDTFIGFDEAMSCSLENMGGKRQPHALSVTSGDRAAYYTLRYTSSLATHAGNAGQGVADAARVYASASHFHDVLWPGVAPQLAKIVTPETIAQQQSSPALLERLAWDALQMIPAAGVMREYLRKQHMARMDVGAGGRGQEWNATIAPVQRLGDLLQKIIGSQLCAMADTNAVSFASLACEPGSAFAKAALRSHLACLRVPPFDAFQRLVLPVPLLLPPWYHTCKVCKGSGHFDMDCPAIASAWTPA